MFERRLAPPSIPSCSFAAAAAPRIPSPAPGPISQGKAPAATRRARLRPLSQRKSQFVFQLRRSARARRRLRDRHHVMVNFREQNRSCVKVEVVGYLSPPPSPQPLSSIRTSAAWSATTKREPRIIAAKIASAAARMPLRLHAGPKPAQRLRLSRREVEVPQAIMS